MVDKKDISLEESFAEQLAAFDFEVGSNWEEMSRQGVDDFDKHTTVKSVLELGCGDGAALKKFVELGYTATGVDINPQKIERCPKETKAITSDVLEYLKTLEDGSVENIFTHHFLEHAIHYEEILNESSRVLKKGGIFMGIVPAHDHVHSVHHVMFESPYDIAINGFEAILADSKGRLQWEFHYIGKKNS